MSFDEIMMKITKELTGDRKHDVPYLQKQCEKYKKHEYAQEILRACGRLMYGYASEEQKAELNKIVENQNLGYESILEEVRFKAFEQKYTEALVLIEGLIKKIEEHPMYTDDAVSEYRCFNEFFEEALYTQYHQSNKTVRHPPVPFDVIYLQYGSLLVELKRHREARTALEKALRWNPASADIAFEHAESCKMLGDMESYLRYTIDIFRYAFRPRQVARCFRNLGYYFIEKEQWSVAVACYSLSMLYEKNSTAAISELYYIHEKVGDVEKASQEEMKALSIQYGFPLGAHEDVVGMAYSYGKHFWEQKNVEAAKYCWTIAYGLTEDNDIQKLLDLLSEKK